MDQLKINNWIVRLLIIGATVFFGIRLFRLINRHAVNILFFDQWDFLIPLFRNPTAWEMFTYQHGPHRQGLGLFVSQAVGSMTNWDTRAECYAVGIILILTLFAALILKKRLFGEFSIWDVLIPSIVLSFTQIEAVVLTPNPAHGVIPILLTIISGIFLTFDNKYLRYIGLAVIAFFATYTGFGFFLGAVMPVIFLVCFLLHLVNKELQAIQIAGICCLVSIISFGSFFLNYSFSPVQDCFQPPFAQIKNYLTFVCLELAMFLGFDSKSSMSTAAIFGMILLIGLISAFIFQAVRLWKKREFDKQSLVIGLLIVYSLLFVVNSASGRLCNGLVAAQTSRYMTLLIPAFLGLYFAVQNIPQTLWRGVVNCLLLCGFIVLPIFALKKFDQSMGDFSQVKRSWAACYVEQESIENCDKAVGNAVYPIPKANNMKEKLEILKENHYNLFKER